MCRRQHHHDAVFVVSASGCQQRRRQQARQYATQVVTYVDVTFVSTPARLMTTSLDDSNICVMATSYDVIVGHDNVI